MRRTEPEAHSPPRVEAGAPPLGWITVAPGSPYFVDEEGAPWHPIGQNDAITWPELAPLFRRRDLPAVEAHLRWLKDNGVTVLRLMLEYAQVRHRYFERPAGRFVPAMVQLWDDLFALCERVGLRILLTPVDTFWTWLHWRRHPWAAINGGPCDRPGRMLTCPAARGAIKARLEFAVRRWGGSGALFAWDLWNEIHPAHAEDDAAHFDGFIADLSGHVRGLEVALYGRSHPQTVSVFGPVWWEHDDPSAIAGPIFRHPDLDFASVHIYRKGALDDPVNTVGAAAATGAIVRASLAEIADGRPFFDSEHGPIHSFKDKKRTLPEPFDDEYFRHMAWAHLASGGAGGGMRWPNRHPHVLTSGMRAAQAAMAGFMPQLDWTRFARRNFNREVSAPGFYRFACGDERQALIWLLRRRSVGANGLMRRDQPPLAAEVRVPGLVDGPYRIQGWDTASGVPAGQMEAVAKGGALTFVTRPIAADRAFAIRPSG